MILGNSPLFHLQISSAKNPEIIEITNTEQQTKEIIASKYQEKRDKQRNDRM